MPLDRGIEYSDARSPGLALSGKVQVAERQPIQVRRIVRSDVGLGHSMEEQVDERTDKGRSSAAPLIRRGHRRR